MFKHSESVPKAMRPIFDEIVAITDTFCAEHLTESYAALARYMAAALSRKRPSPLLVGRRKTWAAGIVYALGRINFLFDPANTPHLTATDLCGLFGISQGAAYGKSKEAWDALGLVQMDPRWSLPEFMDKNPVVWMVFLDGLIVDIRHYHRETQEVAFEQGLIPFVPSPEGKDDAMACQKGLLPGTFLDEGVAGGSDTSVVRLFSLEITYDELDDEFNRRMAQVPVDGQALFESIGADPHGAMARLKTLVEQYPDVPTLSNWLCVAHSRLGNHREVKAVVETSFHRHPGYLFGRLNYAEILLGEGKLREAFEIFGKSFVLTDVVPGRETFHFSEVLSFYGLVARYVLSLGKLKTAMSFLGMLRQVKEDHHTTRLLEEMITRHTPRQIPPDAKRFLSMR
ncbi:MAG: hypothetical protein HQL59_13195 [Magnetococcales bacterium]|nr:hypothetical protein [Magnetococcales bacterium]